MFERRGISISLGRNADNDFIVPDTPGNKTVSGNHCSIFEVECYTDEPEPGETPADVRFFLSDHSTNGSYVNGVFVHNADEEIHLGDQILLGKHYKLDLDQVFRLHFSGSRTTTRKPSSQEAPETDAVIESQSPETPAAPPKSAKKGCLGIALAIAGIFVFCSALLAKMILIS